MKISILLIEDDLDMRELVSGHLEHSGFDVQKAEDGIKGQALALQYSPDIILLVLYGSCNQLFFEYKVLLDVVTAF